MIAYFPQVSDTVIHALSSIADYLTIAKDYRGNIYMPSQGIIAMPKMLPGEGYKVLINTATALAYPSSGYFKQGPSEGSKHLLSLPQPTHYLAMLNTGSNAIQAIRA